MKRSLTLVLLPFLLTEGARSLLVSRWNVSDSATKELMVAFYQHYVEHGNKAIALQQAM